MDKSIKSDGVCSFEITESNNQKIHALLLYAQMLDLVVTGDPGNDMEHINEDVFGALQNIGRNRKFSIYELWENDND